MNRQVVSTMIAIFAAGAILNLLSKNSATAKISNFITQGYGV